MLKEIGLYVQSFFNYFRHNPHNWLGGAPQTIIKSPRIFTWQWIGYSYKLMRRVSPGKMCKCLDILSCLLCISCPTRSGCKEKSVHFRLVCCRLHFQLQVGRDPPRHIDLYTHHFVHTFLHTHVNTRTSTHNAFCCDNVLRDELQ